MLVSLAEGEEAAVRARYLVAAILHYELRASDEAVALDQRSPRRRPPRLRKSSIGSKRSSRARRPGATSRAYRRMIKRMGTAKTAEAKTRLLTLWRAGGDVPIAPRGFAGGGVPVLEVVTQLDP